MSDERKPLETAVPQVNFTITTAERVGALAAGVPAWSRRKRRIEDLDREIAADLAAHLKKHGAVPDELPPVIASKLEAMNDLIDKHNRYYPIEANLRIDPHTGRMLEGSQPWKPMAERSAAEYLEAAQPTRR